MCMSMCNSTVTPSLPTSILQDIIVGMRFGQFGREEGALILVGQGGSLTIKILKRSVVFEPKDVRPGELVK